MPFNSLEFLVLFIVLLIVYYFIPLKVQWGYLLIASFAYYALWDIRYIVFLLISICLTYITALMIEKERRRNKRGKIWLILSLLVNIGLLLLFKYSQMFVNCFAYIKNLLGQAAEPITVSLLIPVGISFYTFKVVGYMIDVYKGKIMAEKNWGKYALYVSFFPQIVSGPIERSYNFIPQIEKGHEFDYDTVKEGFILFLCGLLKKIVIADRLAILVNQVFDNVGNYGTLDYILAIFCFTMQIYFDFAGYSDMAIGCAKILGISTMKNFDRPYFSTSIADFWRRWHISLSTWFRDHLYIPLGGNRVSLLRWTVNMMIVFLVSGLWHGSNLTFLVWGGIHGIYQVLGKYTQSLRETLWKKLHISAKSWFRGIISRISTFILVAYAWMFFRANSIGDSLYITKSLFKWNAVNFDFEKLGMTKYDLLFSTGIIAIWFILELIQEKVNLYGAIQKMILPLRWGIYLILIFTCILFGIYGDLSDSSFIYFQF